LGLIAKVAGPQILSPQYGFGAQIRRTFSHRRKTTVRLLLASSPTSAICQSSPHGYKPAAQIVYGSKALLQDTVNGGTGWSSAIRIATGIFSIWRAAGIMRPVHPNLHIACDPPSILRRVSLQPGYCL
jgi:hypothetical protein